MSISGFDPTGEEIGTGAPDDIIFRVTKSAGGLLISYDVAYTITLGADNATNGDDYALLSGIVTVPGGGGATQADIVVDIDDDNIVEGPEDITITLDTPAQGAGYFVNLLANSATATIVDNDTGIVSLDVVTANFIDEVNEDGSGTFSYGQFRPIIDKANGTPTTLTVDYTISGSAEEGTDYDLTNAVVLTFVNNGISRARNIRVAPIDDSDAEPGETVIITLTGTDNPLYTIDPMANSATITIIDDDCAAGDEPPELNDNTTAFCDNFTVQLDSYFSEARPPGAFLIWTLNPNDPLNQADWAPRDNNSPVSAPGFYYAFFWDETNNCASPITELELTQSFTPEIGTATDAESCNTTDFGGVTTLNLNTTLSGSDPDGEWTYVDGPGGSVNPDQNGIVDFDGRQDGNYIFQYELVGTAPCVNQTLEVTISVTDCNRCLAGNQPPTLDIDTPTAFCNDIDVSLDDYTVSQAPPGTVFTWSTDSDLTNTNAHLTQAEVDNPLPDTQYHGFYYDATNDCASPDFVVTLTLGFTPAIGTATNTASCNTTDSGGVTTLNLNTTLNGSDPGGEWIYVSGPETVNPNTSGIVDFNNRPDGIYVFRYTLTATAPCVDQSLEVSIPVNDCDPCIAGDFAPTLNDNDRTFCGEIDRSLNDFFSETPPPNTELRWASNAADPTNSFIPDSQVMNPIPGTYQGFFYDELNDCASPTVALVLTLNPIPELPEAQGVERCGPGEVTLTVTPVGSITYNWYANPTGGAILDTGQSFTREVNQTTTYYVEATENNCSADQRVAVEVVIEIQPSAGTAATGVSSCNDPAFGTTTLDLDNLLTDEDEGDWVFTSGPIDVPRNNANEVDFNGRPDGIYVYTFTTFGAQAPCVDESVSVSISVSSCDTDADGDGLLGGLEAALGTDPNNADSDGDGINDNVEVGTDVSNPLDEDEDGIIDALDSNIADSDGDGVVDQLDPANNNACIPDINNELCDQPIDLEVLKIVDNPNAAIGSEVMFTVTVNNLGERLAKTIAIGDFLETGFEYLSHEPSSGAYDPATGQWQLENLEPAASATLTISVIVIEDGTYTNTAELLSSDPLDDNPANDSQTVSLGVDQPEGINLVVEKTARLGPGLQRLQNLTGLINDLENELRVEYFIKVINKSENDAVSNTRVADIFSHDSNVEFEIIDPVVPNESTFNASSGIWTISRSLARDEEIELSYTVIFRSVDVVLNTAEIVSSSPGESNAGDSDSRSTVSVEITTSNPQEIGILYNQFSPNADGINDLLKVNRLRKNDLGLDELVNINYSIEIYDRYGSLIYEGMNITQEQAWDGTWEGKQAPEGTYFYALNVTIEGETEMKTSKGWIQLIR